MLTEGRIDEGINFLESVSSSWKDLNSFMHTHNWWHLALFYLSKGKNAKALKVYDNHVWGIDKEYSQDQIGATSLLARIEFAGVNVGKRWQDIAKYISIYIDLMKFWKKKLPKFIYNLNYEKLISNQKKQIEEASIFLVHRKKII